MNISLNTFSIYQDPLGLRDLPLLKPDTDGWESIRLALEAQQTRQRRRKTAISWFAIAASLVLAVVLTTRQSDIEQPGAEEALAGNSATQITDMASEDVLGKVDLLISLSQTLETQLRSLREGTSSMPGNSAVYVAELEDLVAQVDSELSYSPNSINLWGQRVNLLLDLAQIYQHHWEIEYGMMASL